MIAEKIWSKLTGSYANAEGGWADWVLDHITNDYSIRISPHNKGLDYTWKKIKEFSRREYSSSVGTKPNSYLGPGGGHAITLLKAEEITLNGRVKRILKLRNPWGTTDWKGAYSKGTRTYRTLAAHFRATGVANEDEGGLFFADYDDYMKQVKLVSVNLGKESERQAWQPIVDLRNEDDTKHTI